MQSHARNTTKQLSNYDRAWPRFADRLINLIFELMYRDLMGVLLCPTFTVHQGGKILEFCGIANTSTRDLIIYCTDLNIYCIYSYFVGEMNVFIVFVDILGYDGLCLCKRFIQFSHTSQLLLYILTKVFDKLHCTYLFAQAQYCC